MARPPRLSDNEIRERCEGLPDWRVEGTAIVKQFLCANFAAAIGFINAVAVLAETADHHPDIRLHGWNKVEISLSTHDQGGLTQYDFDLARKIDTVGT